jgi:Na+-transporting NADH:ubiquinone oxidoreductase subunit NqrB
MTSHGRPGMPRLLAVYVGLLSSQFAGAFLLGAYAQGFETLDELRNRGSDGYAWTWQAALIIGVGATTLAGGLGAALAGQRLRTIYWSLCVAAAALGAVFVFADPPPALTSIALVGMPLVGIGAVRLAADSPQGSRVPFGPG